MALDPRIALAIQAPQVDVSGLVSGINRNREFAARQQQLQIENQRRAELDRQATAQQQLQNRRNVGIDARAESQEKRFTAQEARQQKVFDSKESQFNQQNLNQQVNDLALRSKRALDTGKNDLAADFAVQANDLIANSEIPQEQKLGLKTEIDSLVLDFNTNPDKAKQTLDSFINQTTSTKSKRVSSSEASTKDGVQGRDVLFTDGTTEFVPSTGKVLTQKEKDAQEIETKKTIKENEAKVELENAANIEMTKVLGKDRAAKVKDDISTGVTSADGLVNIREAQELLKDISTGGVDKLKFYVKSKLGVESEDEGVLNNIFEQSIIKQIKPIFGGAPSKDEVFLLRDIEANFGKSPETNKKLMARLEDAVTLRSLRGLRQANNNKFPEQVFQISSSLGIPEQDAIDISNIQNQDKRLAAFYKARLDNTPNSGTIKEGGVQLPYDSSLEGDALINGILSSAQQQ